VGAYYRQAVELAKGLENPKAVAHSLNRLGNWHSNVGDFESARRLSEEALQLFREAGDDAGLGQTLDLLGMACAMGGELALSAGYYRQALPLLDSIGDRRTLTSALATLPLGSGTAQTDMFPPVLAFAEATAFAERAVEVARHSGSRSAETFALGQLAFCLTPQAKFELALTAAREAFEIAEEIEHLQWKTVAECAWGAALGELLSAEASCKHLENALRLAREMQSQMWVPQAACLLVVPYILDRRLDLAAALYESIPTYSLDEMQTMNQRFYHTGSAELALALGDYERTLGIVAGLRQKAELSSPGVTAGRLARLEGLATLGLGRTEEALSCLHQGLSATEARGHLTLVWRLQSDLARAYFALGDRDKAREFAAQAMSTVARMAEDVPDDHLRSNFLERAAEHLPPSLRRRSGREHVDALTAREAEIAALIAQGLTNREIADELVLSARTVETHVANAMAKMGFANRSQLAAWAVERGLTARP
jgi:DNA-binding CsgD family transcriptional regulator